jgi:hypothetical protein
MIRLIEGLPNGVVGFEVVGEIRWDDYTTVLDPALDSALASNHRIRLLYVLGSEFEGFGEGSMLEDTKASVSHWTKFEKIAVVTDHKTYSDGVKALGWMMPGRLRTFSIADRLDAETWVTE